MKNITKTLILLYVTIGIVLLLGAMTPATTVDTEDSDRNWQDATLPHYPTTPIEPLPDNPDPNYPIPETPNRPQYDKFVY